MRYKDIRVTEEQYEHIIKALQRYYNEELKQPSETAEDNRKSQHTVYNLLEEIEKVEFQGHGKLYKLVGEEWKLIQE